MTIQRSSLIAHAYRANNIQLPDEYDQITTDIRPFRAFHPTALKKALRAAAGVKDTYVLTTTNGSVRVHVGSSPNATHQRSDGVSDTTATSTTDDNDSDHDDALPFTHIGGGKERMQSQRDMLREILKHVPDLQVEVVHSLQDTPAVVLGWEMREEMERRVRRGECESFLVTG